MIVLVGYFHKIGPLLTNFQATGSPDYVAITSETNDSIRSFDRLLFAIKSLEKYLILFVFLIPAFFLLSKKLKALILAVIVPFTLLWAIVASYDTRNLALVYPLLALVTGLGIQVIVDYLLGKLDQCRAGRLPAWLLPGLILTGVCFLAFVFTKDNLLSMWTQKQKLIFSPGINEQLYELDLSGDCQNILTNYPVKVLPGLEHNQVVFSFDNLDYYEQLAQNPSICWLLIPPYADQSILAEVDEKIQTGVYNLIYTQENWVAYRLIDIR